MLVILAFILHFFVLGNIFYIINTIWNFKRKTPIILSYFLIFIFIIITLINSLAMSSIFLSKFRVLFTGIQYLLIFILPLIYFRCDVKKVIYLVFLYLLLDSSFSSTFSLLILMFNKIDNNHFLDLLYYIASITFQIILMVITLLCRKNIIFKNYKNNIKLIPKSTYILILITLALSGNLTSILMTKTEKIYHKLFISQLFSALLSIILFILIIFFIMNSISNTYHKKISIALKKQFEIQVNHYKMLEDKNTEIKKFRHDFNNHMLCLSSIINQKSYDEALIYISKLNIALSSKTNLDFVTGNFIADAILNEKNNVCKDNGIQLLQDGIFPSKGIDSVDMCIILSNALDNAIEACMQIKTKSKYIKVYSEIDKSCLFITISNPVSKTLTILNNSIPTTKKGEQIHGFGITNMSMISEKYSGDMKLKCENNVFTIQFILFLSDTI